jgi:putative PIN family toxin of toxin-antitoxin system
VIRAVLDCNVFISALIQPEGWSARILDVLIQRGFQCILSPAILEETRRVLGYRRLKRRIALSRDEQGAFLSALSVLALWVEDEKPDQPIVADDPSDDIYLHAAVQGDAGFVVSGDEHLLKLREYKGIAIIPPRLFVEILRG